MGSMTTTNESTRRDELAAIIDRGEHYYDTGSYCELSPNAAADAVLAAGYRKPRIITTIEDLDALATESVVLDAHRVACQKESLPELWESAGELVSTDFIPLPATVLWEPEAEGAA